MARCPAKRAASRQRYEEKNRAARTAKWGEERHARRLLILGHLQQNPCVDCGETDPVVLDFDHRDENTKSFSVANGVSKRVSLEALIAEIAKCDIRCANCHRRRTAVQFNWFKYREAA